MPGHKLIPPLTGLLLITGCEQPARESSRPADDPPGVNTAATIKRWYDEKMVERGYPLFQANCAVCHKPDASGTSDWKTLTPEGHLPPPPLNGTAHTWHHPLSVLRRTIRTGGVPLGGTMPPFSGRLSDQDIDHILAWIQSRWPDDIYRVWHERDQQSRNR